MKAIMASAPKKRVTKSCFMRLSITVRLRGKRNAAHDKGPYRTFVGLAVVNSVNESRETSRPSRPADRESSTFVATNIDQSRESSPIEASFSTKPVCESRKSPLEIFRISDEPRDSRRVTTIFREIPVLS
jgi:hypothetical protein